MSYNLSKKSTDVSVLFHKTLLEMFLYDEIGELRALIPTLSWPKWPCVAPTLIFLWEDHLNRTITQTLSQFSSLNKNNSQQWQKSSNTSLAKYRTQAINKFTTFTSLYLLTIIFRTLLIDTNWNLLDFYSKLLRYQLELSRYQLDSI